MFNFNTIVTPPQSKYNYQLCYLSLLSTQQQHGLSRALTLEYPRHDAPLPISLQIIQKIEKKFIIQVTIKFTICLQHFHHH